MASLYKILAISWLASTMVVCTNFTFFELVVCTNWSLGCLPTAWYIKLTGHPILIIRLVRNFSFLFYDIVYVLPCFLISNGLLLAFYFILRMSLRLIVYTYHFILKGNWGHVDIIYTHTHPSKPTIFIHIILHNSMHSVSVSLTKIGASHMQPVLEIFSKWV